MGNRLVKFILLALLCFSNVSAENMRILHNPDELEELPLPGEIFKLRAALQGSEIVGRIKAFIAVDGVVSELTSLPGVMNEQELMIYTFEVPAPDYNLQYQFFAGTGADKYISSTRYNFQRKCLPDLDLPKDLPDNSDERVLYTIKNARNLEHQIKVYDQALDVISRIEQEFAK